MNELFQIGYPSSPLDWIIGTKVFFSNFILPSNTKTDENSLIKGKSSYKSKQGQSIVPQPQ